MRSRRHLDPLPTRLTDAILSLQPTVLLVPDGSGSLRDLAGNWNAAITGAPTQIAAPSPIERGMTWSGSGQYATTSGSVPTPTGTVMSALVLMSTTDATAATRSIWSRGATNQNSWQFDLNSTHATRFLLFTTTGSAANSISLVGGSNSGRRMLLVGVADGTNANAYAVSDTGVLSTGTPAALGGTWHTASTAGLQVAARADGTLFPGNTFVHAYWHARALTASDARWLGSIAAGG